MRQYHVADIVVIKQKYNSKSIPVGIVTDHDLVTGVVATELDPEVFTVDDIMVHSHLVVEEDVDLFLAIKLMVSNDVHKLLVVNQNGDLVGIVTLDKLLAATESMSGSFAKLLNREKRYILHNRH